MASTAKLKLVDPAVTEEPFKGPIPLGRGDRIYGRDRDIASLTHALVAERIVLLYSPSGAGKTSLINAGIIPRMMDRGFSVLPSIRVSEPLPSEHTSTGRPNRFVFSVLNSLEAGCPEHERIHAEGLAGIDLPTYMEGRHHLRGTEGPRLLVFDQFEEVVAIDKERFEDKRAFFHQLGQVLENRGLWAIFAMREEYLGSLDSFTDWVPTALVARVRLDLLTPRGAGEAIRGPLEGTGTTFDDAAVAGIVEDLAGRPVQDEDGALLKDGALVEPLHLQVACRQIWKGEGARGGVVTWERIEAFGGVHKALAQYFDDQVARIAAGDKRLEVKIRSWVGYFLITPRKTRALLDGATPELKELREYGHGVDVVQKLVKAYLVRVESRPYRTWYELAHDRLIDAVISSNREWSREHESPVERVSRQWRFANKPDSMLFAGDQLRKARRWVSAQGKSVAAIEKEFVEASNRLQWRRAALSGLFVLLAMACLSLVWFYVQVDRSKQELTVSKNQLLIKVEEADRSNRALAESNKELEGGKAALAESKTALQERLWQEEAANRLNRILALATHAQRQRWIHGNPELAALLARQAYLLQDQAASWETTGPHVDNALRNTVFAKPFLRDVRLEQPKPAGEAPSPGAQPVTVFHPGKPLAAIQRPEGSVEVFRYGPSGGRVAVLDGEATGPASLLAFDPARERVAARRAGEVVVYDTAREAVVQRHRAAGTAGPLLYSPDGRFLLVGGDDGTVELLDGKTVTPDVKPLRYGPPGSPRRSAGAAPLAAFSANGTMLAVGERTDNVSVWTRSDSPDGPVWTFLRRLPACGDCGENASALIHLGFGPGGNWLVGVLERGDRVWAVRPRAPDAQAVRLNVAAGTRSHEAAEAAQGRRVYRDERHTVASAAGTSPDGSRLAVGYAHGLVRVWDLGAAREQLAPGGPVASRSWQSGLGPIGAVAVLDANTIESGGGGHGSLVVMSDVSGRVRSFDLASGRPGQGAGARRHAGAVKAVHFLGEGRLLGASEGGGVVVESRDRGGRVTGTEDWFTRDSATAPFGAAGSVRALAPGPDGAYAVVGTADGELVVVDAGGKTPAPRFSGVRVPALRALLVGYGGDWVASGGDDGTVRFWKLERGPEGPVVSGELVARRREHAAPVTALAAAPRDRWLAAGLANGVVEVTPRKGRAPVFRERIHRGPVSSLAFSDDGRRLASAGLDDTFTLLTVGTWAVEHRQFNDSGGVNAVAFAPKGDRLATGGRDGRVSVWRVETGAIVPEPKVIQAFGRHGEVMALDYDAEGKTLAFGDDQGTVRVQSVDSRTFADRVCALVWRNMSRQEWNRYLPDVPYQRTCEALPPGAGVESGVSEVVQAE